MTVATCILIDDQIGALDTDGHPSAMQENFLRIVDASPEVFAFHDAWSTENQTYSEWSAIRFLTKFEQPVRVVLLDMVFGADPLMGLRILDLMNKMKVLEERPRILMTSQRRERRITWKRKEQALGTAITASKAFYLSKACLSDGRKFWSSLSRIERRFADRSADAGPTCGDGP